MQPEARDREDVGPRLGVLPVDRLDELRRVEEGLGAPERGRETGAASEEVGPEGRVEDERRPGTEPRAKRGSGQGGPPGTRIREEAC